MLYTQRKFKDGKVVAYMNKNGSVMRYKLCKIEKKWLTPTLRVKQNYPFSNPDVLNKKMDDLETLVDNTIGELLYDNPKLYITCGVVDDAIMKKQKKEEEQKEYNNNKLLSIDFKLWNMRKKEEFIKNDRRKGLNRDIPPSIKDYISACNAIEDYEYDNNCCLRLDDVNNSFLDNFKDFLAAKHISTKEHKYKCQGGMVNKTINKRLECISAFIRSNYGDVEKAKLVFSARLKSNNNKTIVRLTKDEIESLYSKELSNKNYNCVRDYYVFLCLTGLRFGDFISINKNNFAFGKEGDVTLSLKTQKTGYLVELPLTKQAKEIAERYNYKFDHYTNQAFNRTVKELFKNEGLFEDEIVTHRDVLYEDRQPVKKKRREELSAHSARRTFISILIENGVEPIQVMHLVGHTRLSTLQIYIDMYGPKSKNRLSALEF